MLLVHTGYEVLFSFYHFYFKFEVWQLLRNLLDYIVLHLDTLVIVLLLCSLASHPVEVILRLTAHPNFFKVRNLAITKHLVIVVADAERFVILYLYAIKFSKLVKRKQTVRTFLTFRPFIRRLVCVLNINV